MEETLSLLNINDLSSVVWSSYKVQSELRKLIKFMRKLNMFTYQEIADHLNVNIDEFRRWLNNKKIPADIACTIYKFIKDNYLKPSIASEVLVNNDIILNENDPLFDPYKASAYYINKFIKITDMIFTGRDSLLPIQERIIRVLSHG